MPLHDATDFTCQSERLEVIGVTKSSKQERRVGRPKSQIPTLANPALDLLSSHLINRLLQQVSRAGDGD
jgi:hypothetical protein